MKRVNLLVISILSFSVISVSLILGQGEFDVFDPSNLNDDSRFFYLFLPLTVGNNLDGDNYYATIKLYVDPFRDKVKISKNAASSCEDDMNCQIKAYQALFIDEKQVYIEEIRVIKEFNARAIAKALSEPRITSAFVALNNSFDQYVSCMGACTCYDSAYESCKSGSTAQNCHYDCQPQASKPLHAAYRAYLAEEKELRNSQTKTDIDGIENDKDRLIGSSEDTEGSSGVSGGRGIGAALFVSLITIASGIVVWYLIFKFVLKNVKRLKK